MEFNKIYEGDVLEVLKSWPSDSIDCMITSPPYWSLRSYLPKDHPDKTKEIGLEATFKEYLDKMMLIFTEVKRVMKPAGSLWLNMGDSYGGTKVGNTETIKNPNVVSDEHIKNAPEYEKSLLGQPWRMAIRMQDELGFILRADINWCKQILIWKKDAKYTMGSVMPSSVKDRVNMASEHLFHFTKSKKYFYDMDAVRIPNLSKNPRWNPALRKSFESRMADTVDTDTKQSRAGNIKKLLSEVRLGIKPNTGMIRKDERAKLAQEKGMITFYSHSNRGEEYNNPSGKNIPNNWLIGPEPSKEYHFAKFPTKLCEIPILASCPKEICKKCGKIRERITKVEYKQSEGIWGKQTRPKQESYQGETGEGIRYKENLSTINKTLGWTDCGCNAGFESGIVCDIFMGSGTVAVVARNLGRKWCGIELNKDYIAIAEKKLKQQVAVFV